MPETAGSTDNDPWLGRDKLYHFLFCLSLTILFSHLASLSPYPLIRRHSLRVGSTISLLAGAAKEAADHLGIFPSAGASAKDAVADAVGVVIAAAALSIRGRRTGTDPDPGQARRGLQV